MKRLILTAAAAALMLTGPIAVGSASAQQGQDRRGEQSQDRNNQSDNARNDNARNDVRRGNRDRRQSWRETRRDARWDGSQYNGYYLNNRWHSGPASAAQTRSRNFAYGYRPWSRGQHLGYYQGRYQEVDYRTNRNLRQPPRGYHWVRNDEGDYLLAAIVGGLIAQAIINSDR
ncbi:MAG: RcnB family protein [Terricaulis sp.]